MTDSQAAIDRYAIEFRAVLGALGAIQLVNGVWALFAPSSFYGDFPFGRGWVAALPAYNEHLMRDVGELFLATGLVLVLAAFWLERRLVLTAIWSYLLWAVPHAIYHFFNLEPYGTGDAIGNVIALSLTVLLPIWLLYRMRTGLERDRPRPDSSSVGPMQT
jgi:hypothetical protein